MELAVYWLQLAAAAGIILFAAQYMARSADIIAEKTGLGRSFVGVVMLATATSLPELGTGVTSIVWVGEVNLAAGDAFGSNLFNLLIIGLLDLYWRRGPILASVSSTSAMVGTLGILVISVGMGGMLISHLTEITSAWYISPISVIMFGVFLMAMYIIYKAEQNGDAPEPAGASNGKETAAVHATAQRADYASGRGAFPPHAPPARSGGVARASAHGHSANYEDESLKRAFGIYLITAAGVVAAAVWLAHTGEAIAELMNWDASFVGTQFLALSTSLPELAASIAALRLGAPDLAITNVLGSNLFNMGFVLFLDDIAYVEGSLWHGISDIHMLTAIIAIVMTTIVIVSVMVHRQRIRPFGQSERYGRFATVEGSSMILLYAVASFLVYTLS